jgi:hypothetical protein
MNINLADIELALENNAAILFAYAEIKMQNRGITGKQMTREMCNSLAAQFLADLDWVADGVREIRAERAGL